MQATLKLLSSKIFGFDLRDGCGYCVLLQFWLAQVWILPRGEFYKHYLHCARPFTLYTQLFCLKKLLQKFRIKHRMALHKQFISIIVNDVILSWGSLDLLQLGTLLFNVLMSLLAQFFAPSLRRGGEGLELWLAPGWVLRSLCKFIY